MENPTRYLCFHVLISKTRALHFHSRLAVTVALNTRVGDSSGVQQVLSRGFSTFTVFQLSPTTLDQS